MKIKYVDKIPVGGRDEVGLYWNVVTNQMLFVDTSTVWYVSGEPKDYGTEQVVIGTQPRLPEAMTTNTLEEFTLLIEALTRLRG